MKFAQMISFRTDHPEAVAELLAEWDRGQAEADIMGYIGNRLLANRDDPGNFVILAEFAQVDDELSSADEAELNNQREETARWARQLRELVDGEQERVVVAVRGSAGELGQ